MNHKSKKPFNEKMFVVYSFAISFITAGMLLLGAGSGNFTSKGTTDVKQALTQTPTQTENETLGTIQPDKAFTPSEATAVQLEALRRNDVPFQDAGVNTNYQFASPESKKVIGGLKRYKSLFDGPLYGPLLDHKSAKLGEIKIEKDTAKQIVFVTARDNRIVGYEFLLSRQKKGRFAGCWMTDKIVRLDNSIA